MNNAIDALRVRRTLGRDEWDVPRPYGDGWSFEQKRGPGSVIVSLWDLEDDGTNWIHASISGGPKMPTYEALCGLHRAVWGTDGYAYEIHAPTAQHVNLHPNARHLWGRVDGRPVLPEFGRFGTI